jgi:cell division protein FtsL
MPSASSSYAQPRRRSGPSARGRHLQAAGRVRWDRLGRIAMLFVLMALLCLYLGAGFHMLSTWRQSHRTSARVSALEHEHRLLVGQHNRLSSQSTVEQQARALGMQRPDEQTYIVGNLPAN